ncbi:hypothetical protein GF420_00820 [candidate division GN15 bacterium]|nr:hypothetical protein [candidate division GN15 bacterium]
MFLIDLLLAFVVALILSLILAGLAGWQYPGRVGIWPSLLLLFFILFFATWAGGAWLTPVGPVVWGTYWVPFVLVGFIIALLLAAIVPPRRPRSRVEAIEQAEARADTQMALGVFFWVFFIVVVAAIIARYIA